MNGLYGGGVWDEGFGTLGIVTPEEGNEGLGAHTNRGDDLVGDGVPTQMFVTIGLARANGQGAV